MMSPKQQDSETLAAIGSFFRSNPESRRIVAGLASGVCVAALFNPWDRALYLSVKYELPFLTFSNFRRPYHGFNQAVFGRTLSGGLYFPLYDIFLPPCQRLLGQSQQPHQSHERHSAHQSGLLASFVAGNAAGAVNGFLLNFLTTVKYQSWNEEHNQRTWFRTAADMMRHGGSRVFLKGITPTITRDTIFGGACAATKLMLMKYVFKNHDTPFNSAVASVVGASFGCIISSPWNYSRNMMYATPAGDRPPTTYASLRDLWTATKQQPTLAGGAGFLQQRLRIGWGTARVGVGMAVGWHLYDVFNKELEQLE